MRRVSSVVRGRDAPAGASFPLISTSGGFPGEKKRSLTFAEVFNIDTRSAGVENGAAAGAAAAAATRAATGAAAGRTAGGTTFGGLLPEEDIEEVQIAQQFSDPITILEKLKENAVSPALRRSCRYQEWIESRHLPAKARFGKLEAVTQGCA